MAEAFDAQAEAALWWPVGDLLDAYRRRDLSPVEVTRAAIARIEASNPELNAFLARLDQSALEQAAAAESAYRRKDPGPLAGVPVSVKDTFPVAGAPTTFGSLVYREHVPTHDSGVVRRLRASGAVLVGKTNTAEFGQSATTDNRLGPDCANPWDPGRTPGGSSGGAAASVAAGLASLAVGADGGGSIRIPAAFTGLFGLKPTPGLCRDEDGLAAMTAFVAPGPLARRAGDARLLLETMADRRYPRREPDAGTRVGFCPSPGGHPVDPDVRDAVADAVGRLEDLGIRVEPVEPPIEGWEAIFGPLVLDDEGRERGHLLGQAERLTGYERSSLEAARTLDRAVVERASRELPGFRARVDAMFERIDLLAAPATATTAFPLGERPRRIDGHEVSWLWGAFPFTAPFNVSGNPAVSIPCAITGDLPVGLQLVARAGREDLLLDVGESLEALLAFDHTNVQTRWPALANSREVTT